MQHDERRGERDETVGVLQGIALYPVSPSFSSAAQWWFGFDVAFLIRKSMAQRHIVVT